MLQDAFFADPIPCDGGTPPYGRKRVFKLHLQTTIFLLRSFNYWIGPSETEGAFFILDLGCCISVNKVILRNSYHIWNNGGINERWYTYSTYISFNIFSLHGLSWLCMAGQPRTSRFSCPQTISTPGMPCSGKCKDKVLTREQIHLFPFLINCDTGPQWSKISSRVSWEKPLTETAQMSQFRSSPFCPPLQSKKNTNIFFCCMVTSLFFHQVCKIYCRHILWTCCWTSLH